MKGERRLRITADAADAAVTAVRLGEVCRIVTDMAGAGITLMSGDRPVGTLCSTGEVSALIEDLQYTLGKALVSTPTSSIWPCSSSRFRPASGRRRCRPAPV